MDLHHSISAMRSPIAYRTRIDQNDTVNLGKALMMRMSEKQRVTTLSFRIGCQLSIQGAHAQTYDFIVWNMVHCENLLYSFIIEDITMQTDRLTSLQRQLYLFGEPLCAVMIAFHNGAFVDFP